jgi:hypothetical protein
MDDSGGEWGEGERVWEIEGEKDREGG